MKGLLKLLDYDRDSGTLIWNQDPDKRHRFKGKIAGYTNVNGYQRIIYKGKEHLVHRLIWYIENGEEPNIIDHIDGNPSNNHISNLRNTDTSGNGKNRKVSINSSSGISGVTFDRRVKKWHSRITHRGKRIFLGHYRNKEDAILAREEAEKKYNYIRRQA